MTNVTCSVAQRCGGCPLLDLSEDAARERKTHELRRALVHELGDEFEAIPIEWFSLHTVSGYRHRLRLKIEKDGKIRFFNQEKSLDCAVLEPGLRKQVPELLAFANELDGALEELCHLEVRARDLDGRYGACFYPRNAKQQPSMTLLKALNQLNTHWLWAVAHDEATIPYQRHALLQSYHYVPLTSFLQVNRAVNDTLVSKVVEGAIARNLHSFCDLYAGAGNFTLPLLSHGLHGTAVEYDENAMSACELSAIVQGLSRGQFLTGDTHERAQELAQRGERFELVLIDPPRAGAKDALRTLASLSTSHIVYCSCNPASLARDLSQLMFDGWHVESITAYDMFEGTKHLETCVWLGKSR
jgi:23S rRNA (uracil1939-C5)-methyltransferase